MRTDRMRSSENVEDRRGMGPAGGRRPGPTLAVGGGLGGIVIVLLFILLGGNPQQMLGPGGPLAAPPGGGPSGGMTSGQPGPSAPLGNEAEKLVVSKTLGDTEDVWGELFRTHFSQPYPPPRLILFAGATDSAGGFADAAVGPFYCPADSQVYIDLTFLEELDRKFGAPGDFAQAYVVAHEVGHHIQNLLGTSAKVHRLRQQLSETEYNDLSVRLELQADYFAGVWAHHAQKQRQILDPGDLEEALAAAAAVGDDRLQQRARGYVVPDSFTHGTSAQRMKWFKLGFESGDPMAHDPFKVDRP